MKRRPAPKHRTGAWFVPLRWSYIPCAWQGWLTYFPFILYLMVSFIMVDRTSHTILDTLLGIIPYWVAGAAIMQWIASHKS